MRGALLGAITTTLVVSVYANVSLAAALPTEHIAVVLVGKDAKDPLATAFVQALYNLADRSPDLTLVGEKGLTKNLKGDPVKMFTKCGPQLGCITKLGRKAKTQAVLFGKWARANANEPLTLQYLLIATSSQKIRQKGVLSLAKTGEAARLVADNFQAMFGLKPPLPLPSEVAAAAAPPAPPELAPPMPPAPPEPPAAPAPVAAAPHEAAPAAGSAVPATAPAPLPAPDATAVGRTAPTDTLFVTSLVIMSVGAVTAATGGALVLDAHHDANQVNTSSASGIAPASAIATINSANSKIRTGNLLMEVGGGVAVVGGVLLALDLLNVFGTNPHNHVALHLDPRVGAVGWAWKQAF